MNNKAIKILVPVVIVAIVAAVVALIFGKNTNKEPKKELPEEIQKYFAVDTKYSAIYPQVYNQKAVNEELAKELKKKEYTLDNAYVKLNPYNLSPLSAIIIFQTAEEEEIKVTVNGKYVTTMEKTKLHSIPVWGLYEDYDNIVKLEGTNSSKEYTIKTEKSNLEYPLEVLESHQVTEEVYFMIASYSTHLTAWDTEGKLRFYLTAPNSMDVEWLDNGHFLLGTPQGQAREQYVGFVEMDYLGKVYNYYTLKNGYSFEFQVLSNGNIMMAGGNVPVYMTHSMIHTIDPKSARVVDDLDIYEIVKAIDPTFSDKYLGAGAIRNGFYYDEKTGDIVVSFRNANTIWCFDYKNKQLKWVLTDPTNPLFQAEVWKDYFMIIDSGRYPMAQHSPQIVNGNKLFYQNNGYDRLNVNDYGKSDAANTFDDAYTDCELLEIDATNKRAKTVWVYDHNKEWLSIKFGYARWNSDNSKLMNFGYIVNDDYRKTDKKLLDLEKAPTNTSHRIIELDANDNVIFDARSYEGKYRAFKHVFYSPATKNIDVGKLNILNTIPNTDLTNKNYKDAELDKAVEWINTLDITKNTLVTDYTFKEDDQVDLYLVNKDGKVFIMNYLSKDNKLTATIFNLELPANEYALFIKVNDILYDTKSLMVFSR